MAHPVTSDDGFLHPLTGPRPYAAWSASACGGLLASAQAWAIFLLPVAFV